MYAPKYKKIYTLAPLKKIILRSVKKAQGAKYQKKKCGKKKKIFLKKK